MENLVPPLGGRIHLVKAKVPFDQSQVVVNTTGPGEEEEFILLNFPKGDGSWEKALAWAEQFRLRRTGSHKVLAVGVTLPNLSHDAGVDDPTAYVVATEEILDGNQSRALCVRWDGAGYMARLRWVNFYGRAFDWLAFQR